MIVGNLRDVNHPAKVGRPAAPSETVVDNVEHMPAEYPEEKGRELDSYKN